MLTVTPQFTVASTATIRKPKAKIDILWTDPYVDPALTATSNDEDYHIPHVRTLYGTELTKQTIDLLDTTPHAYTILDGTWTLNGTKYLAPSTPSEALINQLGWYTNSLADSNGNFYIEGTTTTTTPGDYSYPQLIVEFGESSRPISILKVTGEQTLNQYPVDFDVYIYNGITELYHEPVTNNTLVLWSSDIVDEAINNATSMKLVLKKWSTANTMAKIVEFFTIESDSFEGDVIVSMGLLEEREIRDGSLPVGNISCNEIDLELQNVKLTRSNGKVITDPFSPDNDSSDYKNILRPNRRIIAYLGFEVSGTPEYIPVGTFWTGDWICKDDSFSVSVSCRDRLEILRNSTFESDVLLENATLYEIAEYVLNHAKENIPLIDLEWDIDTELQNFVIPFCWFEKDTYFAAIRNIAEACIGQAYMTKDDVLKIESYKANDYVAADLVITENNYFSKDQPANTDDLKNYIEVETQQLGPELDDDGNPKFKDVYTSPTAESITGNQTRTIEIHYEDKPVVDAYATIIEQTGSVSVTIQTETYYYPWGAVLTVINSTANTGTFKIKVDGIRYSFKGSTIKTAFDTPSITENGKKTYKFPNNYLVQTDTVAQIIADNLLASYHLPRRDLTLNWRGTPALELGDTINVPTYGVKTANYVVYKNKFDFDSGLKCTTSARKVEPVETTTTGGA